MGKITLSEISFKPASIVYSRANRLLKSYGLSNSIDEGEYPVYTKDVIGLLGLGMLMESKAIVEVKNKKACLPDNYKYLYAAYKCSPDFTCDSQTRSHIQNGSFSYTTDITDQIAIVDNACELSCVGADTQYLETVTLNNVVTETNPIIRFNNFCPLHLVPDITSPNKFCHGWRDISIENGVLYTGFDEDFVFVQYYGFPVDEDGELLIPDNARIEKAVLWCIIYNTLLSMWFDPSITDIQTKLQFANAEYEKAFLGAKNYLKTPSFAQMINSVRTNRQNMLAYMSKEYPNTNYERTF